MKSKSPGTASPAGVGPIAVPLPYCNRRLREARLLAWCGTDEAGIASYFGITMATFKAWMREHPELRAAVRSGKCAHETEQRMDPKAHRDAIAMLASRAARGIEHHEIPKGPGASVNPYEWIEPGAVSFSQRRGRQAEKMAAWGMTEEQIVAAFGLSSEGWAVWKSFPAFARALERGLQLSNDGNGRRGNWALEALLLSESLGKQRRRARRGVNHTLHGVGRTLQPGGGGNAPRRTGKIVRAAAAAGPLGTSLMISTKTRGQ